MHRKFTASTSRLARIFVAVALISLIGVAGAGAARHHARSAVLPVNGSGGARFWIAFDPAGRTIGPVQFLQKQVQILNTTSASNAFTITYKPAQSAAIPFCKGTLGPAQLLVCGAQSSQHLENRFFQVVAARPVVMGGRSEVPTIDYQQQPDGSFGADPSKGTIQNIPFNWQQGCSPFAGSGCPSNLISNGQAKKPTAKNG